MSILILIKFILNRLICYNIKGDSMNDKFIFKKVARFKFLNKKYQMFETSNGKMAFLEVYENNRYRYPEYNDYVRLIILFSSNLEHRAFYNNDNQKKYSFIPKFVKDKKTFLLTSLIISSLLTGCSINDKEYVKQYSFDLGVEESYISDNSVTDEIKYTNANEDEIETEDVYTTEDYFIMKSAQYISLYNNRYYSEIFEEEEVSIDDLYKIVDSSRKIPKHLKDFVKDFIGRMSEYYPDLDFRVFKHNLKKLTIQEKSQDEIEMSSLGLAYYDHEENLLVISETADVYNNPRAKIIFAHELGHLFNNAELEKDGFHIKIQFNDAGKGKYIKEAIDVIFTSNPYLNDQGVAELESLGYSIITNNIRVILDSLPDYNLSDSVSNNIYYLENKMDKFMSDELNASRIIELLDLQWIEYSSGEIEVDSSDYDDLYEYLSKMYIKAHVTQDMAYDDIILEKEKLEYMLTLDVIDDEYVNIDKVEEVFENYMLANNKVKTNYSK